MNSYLNFQITIDNFKESTKKLLEVSKFNKFTDYKINMQKLIAFLYTNNDQRQQQYK